MIGGAFVVSLFFIGFNIHVLCAVLLLLVVRLAMAVWPYHSAGLAIPRSLLAASLIAYPLWLAVSLLWSPVPSISHATFWWAMVGPLVYWGLVLGRPKEEVWARASVLLLLAGIGLAVVGIYQRFVLADIPSGPFLDRNVYAALLSVITFPLAGQLVTAVKGDHSVRTTSLTVGFFILVFGIALTQSRSAMVTFALGALIFVGVAWHRTRARRLFILGALTIIAFVAANISWDGGLVDKLATLQAPHESGYTRFLIWESTWRMILNHPWTGVGLGMYPLLWPPYRQVEDTSAGYFAHNDYLQTWVDAGLPALILFLAVLIAAAHMIVRQLRAKPSSDGGRPELGGLAASVAALCANSLLNYNFYVVPSLIVFGMLLARLQVRDPSFRYPLTVKFPKTIRQTGWRAIVVLAALFPVLYFVSVAAASIITDRAIIKANAGAYEAADADFALAHRLWPSAESILLLRADLYRHLLSASDSKDAGQRLEIFQAATGLLQQAEQLNPFRADIFMLRADLVRSNAMSRPDLWRQSVERDYRQALALDPWHFRARYRLGTFLLEQGRLDEARAVLEAGVSRAASVSREELIPYLALTAKLRQQGGDTAGADPLVQRAKELAQNARSRRLQVESAAPIPSRLFSSF